MSSDVILDNHIIYIIQRYRISEQSELQEMLRIKNHDIPQATLSRRLKRLNIAKIDGIYQLKDLTYTHLPVILNVEISDFGIVVFHTQPGNASSLASFLDLKYVNHYRDKQKPSGILGTIAGDDTVLMIIKSAKDLKSIISLIKQDFPYISLENNESIDLNQ